MPKAKDLTGQKFGRLTVLRPVRRGEGRQSRWFCYCQCDCGEETTVRPSKLTSGQQVSCGCNKVQNAKYNKDIAGQKKHQLTALKLHKLDGINTTWVFQCDCGQSTVKKMYPFLRGDIKSCGCYKANRLNIEGQKFNQLTAIQDTGKRDGIQNAIWLFRCDCGVEVEWTAAQVCRGQIKSCGCHYKTAGGMSRTKTYRSWLSMHHRCKDKANHRYGGRGISVCKQWDSFDAFLKDMGECPDGYSIERKNFDDHYCPSNCEWIPLSEQALNTSTVTKITYNGKTLAPRQWEELTNIPRERIYRRYRSGWPLDKVFAPETYPDLN